MGEVWNWVACEGSGLVVWWTVSWSGMLSCEVDGVVDGGRSVVG